MNSNELGELLKTLTTDQLRFVAIRQECKSDAEAARRLGINKTTVCLWGEPVQRAVRLIALDSVHMAQELLRRALNDAIQVKISGLYSRNERIKQDAATEIIDRALGKPAQPLTGKNLGAIEVVISWDENAGENQG